MTQTIRHKYIEVAIADGLLPKDAHRMPDVISLNAPKDRKKPIQFWQLYSVMGQDRIVEIVADFYQRVFSDEEWFRSVFERVGGLNHHIGTQASMWIDTMGGGPYYHGAEFRLSFHHTHNAHALMDAKGAARWSGLMVETLNSCGQHMTDDPRVRPSLNTFLTYFFGRYADEFGFENAAVFGPVNSPLQRKINFINMTSDAIEALPEDELRDALIGRGVDVSGYANKAELVAKALML
ncbi:MAG: hypothetical protein ACPGGK_04380 [Pikeienuella sp.]